MWCSNYFLQTLVTFILFNCFSCALNSDDEGVCVVKISTPKTRLKYYTTFSNKYCGKKKCVIKKSKKETYTVAVNQTVCCTGYEYNSTEDKCTPHCSTGCLGGTCVAPDVCQCALPTILDPEHGNRCVTPSCDLCVNAECVNGSCACVTGFKPENSTHCVPICENGYMFSHTGDCTAVCDEECIQGSCTKPNTCTCNEGYIPKDKFECVPICDTCENGTCIAPNNCTCLDGYEKDSELQCVPICNACDNGDCIAPGTCECKPGFTMSSGACIPVCEPKCVNAVCVGHNKCKCQEGFGNGTLAHVCYKPCVACNGTCLDGVCVDESCRLPKYSYVNVTRTRERWKTVRKPCSRWSLRKCNIKQKYTEKYTSRETTPPLCCAGWKFDDLNDTCHPLCELGCKNGTCIAPDVCKCDPPLILTNHECITPICNPECFNAVCTDLDTCTCNERFTRLNDTHCAPICDTGFELSGFECKPVCTRCHNGECLAPETCNCSEGYKLVDGDCKPKCDPECRNAECIAPNECRCLEGYEKESAWNCKPKCDKCDNGDCVAPNDCKCKDGYKKSDGVCSPFCEKDCNNGFCSAPETCTCTSGYENKEDRYSCEPKCDFECVNASCSSPNNCTCLSGYQMTNDPRICAPACDRCENGSCVAPDTCICSQGYSLLDGKCIPQCEENCTNGFCSAPNTCTCHSNYELDSGNPYICQPICDPACVNGFCESPNSCLCYPGYKTNVMNWSCVPICKSCKDGICRSPNDCKCSDGYKLMNDDCIPICEHPCVNGKCSSPNNCTCNDGYKKNDTVSHICYKPCASCIMGTCDIDGRCNCDPGFSLMNDTCVSIIPVECSSCNSTCSSVPCWCEDGTPCYELPEAEPAQVASSLSLAGLELTWLVAGVVGLVLVVLMIIIIQRMWRRHKVTTSNGDFGTPFDNLMFTVPNTLVHQPEIEEDNVDECKQKMIEHDSALDSQLDHEFDAKKVQSNGDTCLKLIEGDEE